MRVDILKVSKDISTLHGENGSIIEAITISVTYTANIMVDKCSICGDFKFDDEVFVGEDEAKEKICQLFLERRSNA